MRRIKIERKYKNNSAGGEMKLAENAFLRPPGKNKKRRRET